MKIGVTPFRRQKIEAQKVRTYWETGRLINEYVATRIPAGKERAEYDKQIVEDLARDLEITDSVLYQCMRFAAQFKKVAARPLSWAHYRTLITVEDEDKRKKQL